MTRLVRKGLAAAVCGVLIQTGFAAEGPGDADDPRTDIQKVLVEIQQVEQQMGERLRLLRENSDRAKILLEELGRIKTRQFEIEKELNGIWDQDQEYLELKKQRDEKKARMEELFTTNAGKKDE